MFYKVTEEDEITYTGGDCWALALAFLDIDPERFPAYSVSGMFDWDNTPLEKRTHYHAFNFDKKRGLFVDVFGYAPTPESLLLKHDNWYNPHEPGMEVGPISVEDLVSYGTVNFSLGRKKHDKKVAKALMKSHRLYNVVKR